MVMRAGPIATYSRLIMVVIALCAVRADAAAQQSLTSVLFPGSDTTAARKSAKVKSGFVRDQLENDRVMAARIDKRFELKKVFRQRGIAYPAEQIYLRVFKRERELEMWVRPAGQDTFALLKTYEICALGNTPGPKRVRGDLQTPEGYYYIDNFNPQSGYYLSMRVNYPNEADRVLGGDEPLGGDIFIHGGCKTAGCIAVTNENIKEVYWMAVEARDRGQTQIPVHIFPARMEDAAVAQLVRTFGGEPDLVNFWANLKPGYDFFERSRKLPVVTVNRRGRYVYRNPGTDPLLGSNVGMLEKRSQPASSTGMPFVLMW